MGRAIHAGLLSIPWGLKTSRKSWGDVEDTPNGGTYDDRAAIICLTARRLGRCSYQRGNLAHPYAAIKSRHRLRSDDIARNAIVPLEVRRVDDPRHMARRIARLSGAELQGLGGVPQES